MNKANNNKQTLAKYLQEKIKEKGFSMYEVYRRLGGDHKGQGGGVSYTQVQYLIKGKHTKPRYETLKLLSKALNEPYPDLLQAAGYIAHDEFDKFKTRKKEIREESKNILQKYEIHSPPVNIISISNKIGFEVVKSDFKDELSGMIANHTIFINSKDIQERQNFTIAHEIGHFLLHQKKEHKYKHIRFRDESDLDEKSIREEREANEFAACLLMPEEWIIRDFHQEMALATMNKEKLKNLALKYGVSYSALKIRLINLGYPDISEVDKENKDTQKPSEKDEIEYDPDMKEIMASISKIPSNKRKEVVNALKIFLKGAMPDSSE